MRIDDLPDSRQAATTTGALSPAAFFIDFLQARKRAFAFLNGFFHRLVIKIITVTNPRHSRPPILKEYES